MATRPRPNQRTLEGVRRLRHNPDFVALREHLEAELAYCKNALVHQTEGQAIGQLQGRAKQLEELLQIIHTEE